jgi:hypothetical protein
MTVRIAYIDTVSTAQPTHGSPEPWRAHCIRVAVAIEEDRKIVGTLLRLVRTAPNIIVDYKWTARYGVDPYAKAEPENHPLIVAQNLSVMLAGALVVCQNQAFHRDVLLGLFEDAGTDGPTMAGHYCIQSAARPIVDARTMHGKPKAPNIEESFTFFTGDAMPMITALGWREAALLQLNAIRAVYWGINCLGAPADLIEAAR